MQAMSCALWARHPPLLVAKQVSAEQPDRVGDRVRAPLAAPGGRHPGAAVVTRDGGGRVDVKSEVGNNSYVGSASGGIIGLLVGIIGGPVGMLLGGTYGALVGSLFDSELRKARLEKGKDDAHAKVEELNSKLRRTKAGAAA